jgi:hypothetical protein
MAEMEAGSRGIEADIRRPGRLREMLGRPFGEILKEASPPELFDQ